MAEHPAKVATTDLCSSLDDANTRLLKHTQNGTRPAWVRIWRRRGLANLLAHNNGVEHPYRRGEPALVESTPHSSHGAGVWDIKYGDGQRTQLPVMDYVWDLVTDNTVRLAYVMRSEND
jgi:hypothetical protein